MKTISYLRIFCCVFSDGEIGCLYGVRKVSEGGDGVIFVQHDMQVCAGTRTGSLEARM
jgi:hypothetical protein